MVLSSSRASLSNKHDQRGASRSRIYAMTAAGSICTRVTEEYRTVRHGTHLLSSDATQN